MKTRILFLFIAFTMVSVAMPAPLTWTITATVVTAGGTLNPSGAIIIPDGTDTTIFITKDCTVYTYDSLYVNGVKIVGTPASYKFTAVIGDSTLDAYFTRCKLDTAIGGSMTGGIITIDPFQADYDSGAVVTITAPAPEANYSFVGWTGIPNAAFKLSNPLIDTIRSNQTITANYRGTFHSCGCVPGTLDPATAPPTITDGGLWSATTTWLEGIVPTTTDDAIIVNGDLVNMDVDTKVYNMTIQSGGMLNGAFKLESTGGTFTIESNGTFYQNRGSGNKWPQLFTSYVIDANSNYVVTPGASSSMFGAPPYITGNFICYKSGGVLIALSGVTYFEVKGNMTINIPGGGLKLTNNKSAIGCSNIIDIRGNVNVISGYLSAIDNQRMTTNVNVDGNVTVGDASTDAGVATLALTSSALTAGAKRIGVFNIAGDLSFINGAILKSSTGAGTAADEGTINLSGDFSTTELVTEINNTAGMFFAINFVKTGKQTVNLGAPFRFNSANPLTLNDEIAATSNVEFIGGQEWSNVATGSVNGPGQWVVNGSLTLGANDILGGIQAFTLNSGATLTTANANGLDGSFTSPPPPPANILHGSFTSTATAKSTSIRTLTFDGTLVFNGSVAQVTGTLLVAANNLTINNSAGVTLSGNTAVNGTLTMTSGALNLNSHTLTYGASATLAYNGATAQVTGEELPAATPLPNLTINNSAGVTLSGNAAVNGTLTMTSGALDLNSNALTYGASATLAYNGATAQVTGEELLAAIPNLTINNASGVALGGSTTVNDALTFTSGNLTLGANNLTLAGTVSGAAANKCVVTNGAGVVSKNVASRGGIFVFPIAPAAGKYNPVSITNNDTSAQTYTAAVVVGENPVTPADSTTCNRTWSLTKSGSSADQVIFMWYTADKKPSCVVDNCSAWRYDGAQWIDTGGVTTGGAPNTTTVTTSVMSKWTVGSGTLPEPVLSDTITSKTNGLWSDVNTWDTGTVPTALDIVVIRAEDSVAVFTGPASCKNLTVNGIIADTVALTITNELTLSEESFFYLGESLNALPAAAIKDIDSTSTIVLYGAQSTVAETTVGNLYIRTSSGGISFDGNMTIKGNLTCKMSDSSDAIKGTTSTSGSQTHTVKGNVYIQAGTFSAVDVGSASTVGIWNIKRNVLVSGASAAIARFGPFSGGGSAGLGIFNIDSNLTIGSGGRLQAGNSSTAGTGTGIINLKGNLTFTSTANMNSNNPTGPFAINFIGNGVQKQTVIDSMASGISNLNTFSDTVAVGDTVVFANPAKTWGQGSASTNPAGTFVVKGTLKLGTSQITGLQNVEIKSGATVTTGHALGLNGSVTSTGTKTFSTAANYIYNGSVAQVTGTLLPTKVNNLTIDNTSGVFNSQADTVNGLLNLVNGVFGNCTNNVTVDTTHIVYGAGSLCKLWDGVEEIAVAAPREFKLLSNFPNPFNPSTEIRFSVPKDGYATVKVSNMLGQEVATLFSGIARAGQYIPVTFNASRLASGVYFARLQYNGKSLVQRMLMIK
jgi:hypothetical protein